MAVHELAAPAAFEFDSLCTSRLTAGPGGSRDRRVDLSAAHALVREFSVASAFATSDAALAAALQNDASLTPTGLPAALAGYADALDDVCAVPARSGGLAPAQVTMAGHVAFVRPGIGIVELPPDTQIEVIDVRNLPAVEDLTGALATASAPALQKTPAPLRRFARTHRGPVDEFFSPFNIYSTAVESVSAPPLPAIGTHDLPIVLIVGNEISPQAARFAAMVRASGRAWIAGASVPLIIAESDWRGVGSSGIAVRTSITRDPIPLQEEAFRGAAAQDNPVDPTTSSYRREFTVDAAARTLEVDLAGGANTDVDLYLLYDADADGIFAFPDELVGFSFSPTAIEHIALVGDALAPGRYQALVHGYDVPTQRTAIRLDVVQATVLPDTVAADLPLTLVDPANTGALVQRILGRTPPRVTGPAERTFPISLNPFGFVHPVSQTRGDLRAGLIAAHGLVRLFFRYFPIVGDTVDARLIETLDAVDSYDATDRIAGWRILRRFGEALHDGHNFVFSATRLYATYLPVFLEHVGGRPVVRRSKAAGINPGDTIVALNGRPIDDVYVEELSRTSAATLGYQLDIADRYIYGMNGPLTLDLEDTAGGRRSVTVAPQPIADYFEVINRGVSDRPSRPLSALGAPDLYYLNLNAFVTFSSSQMRAAIADATARGSRALILDMRGYPGVNHYEVAARLIQQPFLSPMFLYNQFRGVGPSSLIVEQYSLVPYPPPVFSGPIVLLTGPHAVSAAENFMQMLVGAGRLYAIVGQRSAGTNGNITALSLPGGFRFSYTGMEVRNPGGTPFHGIGIVPDIEVPVTAADLRDRVDRDLLTAISLFD